MRRLDLLFYFAVACILGGLAVAHVAASLLDYLPAVGLLLIGFGCLDMYVDRDTRRPW